MYWKKKEVKRIFVRKSFNLRKKLKKNLKKRIKKK